MTRERLGVLEVTATVSWAMAIGATKLKFLAQS